jgi:(2Fe-2S) ferredoxin
MEPNTTSKKTPVFRKLKHHIFVCTNERPDGHPRGCCKAKGSEELLSTFKEELSRLGLRGEVRAQKSGCLDTCEAGPAVVVYPDNIWYGAVKASDVAEIIQSHLIEGKPVERLRIAGK